MPGLGVGRVARFVLAAAITSAVAGGATHAAAPTARLDIKAPGSTTLGEPIIMTATLHNTTGFRITADFGIDDQTKFIFRHTRPDGNVVRVEPSLPRTSRLRTSRLMLRGNAHTAFVVLDEWLEFSQPGRHTIDLEFTGGVGIEGGNEASLKRAHRLTIDVKPRDAARLRKRAGDWLKQISTLSPGHQTRAASVALLSMKDPEAIPYLELATSRTRTPGFAEALGAMNIAEARTSLERLAASKDPEVRAIAERVLGRIR